MHGQTHTLVRTRKHTPQSRPASRAFRSSLTPSSLTELRGREQRCERSRGAEAAAESTGERKVKKNRGRGIGGGEKSGGARGKAGREVLLLLLLPQLLLKPPDSWERQTADFPPREPGNAVVEPRVRGGGGGEGGGRGGVGWGRRGDVKKKSESQRGEESRGGERRGRGKPQQ